MLNLMLGQIGQDVDAFLGHVGLTPKAVATVQASKEKGYSLVLESLGHPCTIEMRKQ